MKRYLLTAGILLFGFILVQQSRHSAPHPLLKAAFRRPLHNGWIFVHLEGTPAQLGFQHGYLLAPEILDAQRVIALELVHDFQKDWRFFRETAERVFWPHVEQEYREELQGIADGLKARNIDLDLWDVVAANAFMELPYYLKWYEAHHPSPSLMTLSGLPERCSAFVATGSYTKDGRVVMGHNAWTAYLDGQRWNIIFDLVPANGYRMIMDGFPGFIHSADDFGINSAGIMITETTISQFAGWDPEGIPEFVRARKSMQYSNSVDHFARLMREGNNGGYANTWLVADRKTNEIASLELGLKNVTLRRSMDGYFVGANFPVNEALAHQETEFPLDNPSLSPNARRVRWEQLMTEHRGKIDVASGQRFLADHYDTVTGKVDPNERTLCGHIDLSPRGSKPWQPEFGVAGAVQAKVADARLAEHMSFTAAMGHPCGIRFSAVDHLVFHPQFSWQKPYLRDMGSQPWTLFSSVQQ